MIKIEQEEVLYRDMLKTVISGVKNAGVYQSLALVLFTIFFVSLIIFICTKPKYHYKNINHLPFED